MNCINLPKQQLRLTVRLLQKRQFAMCISQPNYSQSGKWRNSCEANRKLFVQLPKATTLWIAKQNYCKAQDDEALLLRSLDNEALVEPDAELSNATLKTLLYTAEDALLQQLNDCQTENEILDKFLQHKHAFQMQHYAQSVILMWLLYRNSKEFPNKTIALQTLLAHILDGLQKYIPNMSITELSYSYLYLRKLGAENSHTTMRELLLRALEVVKDATATIPLEILSRLLVGINTAREFYTPTLCQYFIPHVQQHVQHISNEDDVRLLAICFLNLQPVINNALLNCFKLRVSDMLKVGALNGTTYKALLKLLNMLNMGAWSQQNALLIRDIMHALQHSIPQLNESEIKFLCRVFQHHHEPAILAEPLMQATMQLPQNNLSAFACFMPFVELKRRESLNVLIKQLLNSKASWEDYNASSNFFTILRGLKISDVKTCDTYWSKVLQQLQMQNTKSTNLYYLRHCHRYMNFNNNLGGTYRYTPLERYLSQLSMDAIENSVFGRIPNKFARLAAFVMAYGHTQSCWKKFPNVILSKILSMSQQFTINDCLLLSRGIQIALELRFRFHIPPVVSMQLATIDNILTACADRHLNREDAVTIADLNTIVRSLGFRKTLKNSVIYHKALNKYKELDYSQLNSRLIREITLNLNTSNFLIPEVLDTMCNYVEKNFNYVTGDTVEKLLSCAYNLGYTPKSFSVLEYAASILMRDFEHMSGLSIVQACLALCYYKLIPDELINRVFCVKFIQRIEDEIQMCYSKATYPERVLNLVMQLNRTVCLDFPEANVPWFQQNYLEAHLSRKPTVQSEFLEDVSQLLEKLLKENKYFHCNHITPYGYKIDFVIHFDKDKQLIPVSAESTLLDRITKVAILLLKLDSFCENDLTTIRGPELLKMKHLEMMGYKVLHINEHDWNSKYMNAPNAKKNYLKCLLQISN